MTLVYNIVKEECPLTEKDCKWLKAFQVVGSAFFT